MRVLHVAQPIEAGVPNVVASLLADQVRRGWDVHVAHPDASVLGLAAPEATHHGWEASRSPGPGFFGESVSLSRLFGRIEPDLVHLHSAKAGLAGRAVLRGRLPTVFQPHAWSFDAVEGAVAAAARAWERIAARWSDVVLCVGRVEKERGIAAGIQAAWEVIPNGVDLASWTAPAAGDQEASRARLGIPTGVPVAVCVGRLSRQKGQDVLLRAWPEIHRLFPEARLILVGDGEARPELEQMAVPQVFLKGAKDNPRDYLLAADVAVLPSRWEGMSLSMLEAMACARPVVTTDVAGAEVVAAARAGEVVPVDSPSALSGAITAFFGDASRAKAAGECGRRSVTQEHDRNEINERVASIYDVILERRKMNP